MKKLLLITICVGLFISVAYQYACKNKSFEELCAHVISKISDTTILVKNGEEFSIGVGNCSSMGSSVTIKSLDDQYVTFLNQTSEQIKPKGKEYECWRGGNDVQIFTFKALKRGKTEIIMEKGRWFEKDSMRTLTYTVEIE